MRSLIVSVVASLIFISQGFAQIQPVISDAQGQGGIDWGNRFIEATGIGAPNPDLPQAAC